ncbi:MAG: DUF4270 family protein [Alistipes sp.]|nr:DUF4270 family protein [Alistipes sp.]
MKIFNRINNWLSAAIIIFIVAIATFSGCTTIADYTLGEELTPGHQQMVIRHRIYKGGMLKETDKEATACKVFETRLFRTDSIKTTSLGAVYLGHQKDSRFGNREFGFTGQMLFMKGVDDSIGFGFHPIYDSMMFIFAVDSFAGDTTKPIKYNIYELTGALVPESVEDTIFYANYDPRREGILAEDAKPIFTFQFPDPDNGIYTTSTSLRLTETEASKEFIDRLMCKGKLDANGWANDNVEAYQSDSAFIANFHGLHIEVAEQPAGEGSAFSFVAKNTGLKLLGRMRNPGHDADILADTLNISYLFKDEYAEKHGNVTAQNITYDFTNTEVGEFLIDETEENRDEVSIGYIDGCAGVYTELTFTDEFLTSLRNIHGGQKDYISAAINQAALRIYIDGAEYDYTLIDPISMSEKLNSSITRLGIYTNYKTTTPIPDYLYSQENSGILYYNGYMNRSLACYEMNISSYMQALVNEVLKLEEGSDGKLDFTKLNVPRTIYLAPGAYDRFTFKRSLIQGCDEQTTPATIQLDLTYTLVK